jgi:putative ATPase
MNSLFSATANKPLAERMRPKKLADIIGQEHLLGPNGSIGRMIARKRLSSMILQGPPGVGKTTIASLLAENVGMPMRRLSSVLDGIADLRKAVADISELRAGSGKQTVLFIDEIHRWNKSQQEALLPHVEDGTIILIGATTANASYELERALLSRCPIRKLKRLDHEALSSLLIKAQEIERKELRFASDAMESLLNMADGDGRYLIGMCEQLFDLPPQQIIDMESLHSILERRAISYDKSGDDHYNLLSALQKSIRGSDVQAALYWSARALKGGEPAENLLRRLLIMACEDIGMADPSAITHTVACAQAFDRVGEPEGLIILSQCVVYLASSVKSNAAYLSLKEAMSLVEETGSLPVPAHLTREGKDKYLYDHDFPEAFSGQNFLPVELTGDQRPEFYRPNNRGYEREITKWMAWRDSKRNTTELS